MFSRDQYRHGSKSGKVAAFQPRAEEEAPRKVAVRNTVVLLQVGDSKHYWEHEVRVDLGPQVERAFKILPGG